MPLAANAFAADGTSAAVRRFVVRAACWNVALFALLRLSWVDRHVTGALVDFQQVLVFWYGVTERAGIVVNSSCSGADVAALCMSVTLAYPAAWPQRLLGTGVGLAFVIALNALRITSLYAVAATPERLAMMHEYVWPSIFAVAVTAFLFGWIRWGTWGSLAPRGGWARAAIVITFALIAYAIVVPWAFTSAVLYRAGTWTAALAASGLSGLGAPAMASGNIVVTGHGSFQVTQECLFTPMLPLYVAAAWILPVSGRRRATWLLLAVPIFFVLGVARVLVLALPATVTTTPTFLAHGFYQLLAGALAIIVAAHLGTGGGGRSALVASKRTAAALGLALVAAVIAVGLWEPILLWLAGQVRRLVPMTMTTLSAEGDRQGAIALLPVFQVALTIGLWYALSGGRRYRELAVGLTTVLGTQVLLLMALGGVAAWRSALPHALLTRAWALAVPLALAAVWALPRPARLGDRAYRRFWQEVGQDFPDLGGAASTTFYLENEKRLLTEALPSIPGCTLLKTDLWDEARNTRILQWVADQGARVFAIDLSEPIVRAAWAEFGDRTFRPAVSDVRRLPFADASFDAVYSMGTVEHFAETTFAVTELARVLKPGGRLILGVPNRHDPFLRPMLVTVLDRLGLYGYGYEKSYSRRQLRGLLQDAGLVATLESGILFMPGWLRMLDLWCHTRAPGLARLTAPFVRLFAWIDGLSPIFRRHGYLLASVGVKPSGAPPAASPLLTTGTEYVVDARGCDEDALRSLPRLQQLVAEVLEDLALRRLAPPLWHVFPGRGGVTGLVMLAESHLTIHTFPEGGLAAINLYCCRGAAAWPWDEKLRAHLGAADVSVRVLNRG